MMQELIIQTKNLNFNFGQQKVLDQLSLEVPKGGIYGFLGPNGSGKTTTIKLLLNLLQSSEKNIFLFGKELQENRTEILKKIGSLVEQPAIYPHLTGYENLKTRAMLLQVSKSKVNEILELVGLTDAANKKAEKYSLGMKQRLGIGLALLDDPELLILDEPTNGLDPNGIIEIRNLIKNLAANHQKTIFISSHLLAEIERIATHVGIINKGKMLFQGNIHELHSLKTSLICVETNDNEAASSILKSKYPALSLNGHLEIPFESLEQMGFINHHLIQNDLIVYSIYKQKKDLESLFLDITNA
jgi:lantibiotic transport system ATP-binding protein